MPLVLLRLEAVETLLEELPLETWRLPFDLDRGELPRRPASRCLRLPLDANDLYRRSESAASSARITWNKLVMERSNLPSSPPRCARILLRLRRAVASSNDDIVREGESPVGPRFEAPDGIVEGGSKARLPRAGFPVDVEPDSMLICFSRAGTAISSPFTCVMGETLAVGRGDEVCDEAPAAGPTAETAAVAPAGVGVRL